MKRLLPLLCVLASFTASIDIAAVSVPTFSEWSPPANVGWPINTDANDHYAVLSRDELTIYFTSDRFPSRGHDLWVATRESVGAEWDLPQNMTALNRDATDSLPFLSANEHALYFYSDRPGGCGPPGTGDIWMTRRKNKHEDWQAPVNMGCVLNSNKDDIAPAFFEDPDTEQAWLFYGSNRPGALDYDVYASALGAHGLGGPGIRVDTFSSPARDTRIFIRKDGLEAFITSNRAGSIAGSIDIWVTTRASLSDPWPTPVNVGNWINSSADDGSPWLSKDGTTLYFFSSRPGYGKRDIWYSTRVRLDD